jgi:hypothetical protein
VPVTDLIIKDNDLVAATAGRAFWILDDLGAVQQSRGDFTNKTVKLYQPKPTYLMSGAGGGQASLLIGQNPAEGVVLDYYLKEKGDTTNKVTLEILDVGGKSIRKYSSRKNESFKASPGGPPAPVVIPAEVGVNRFAWDFRTENMTGIDGIFVTDDYRGHRVAPGKYKARINFKGETSEADIEIVADPNLKASPADWTTQQEMLNQVERSAEEITQSINKMTKVKKQVESYGETFKDNPELKELVKQGKDLVKKIEQWQSQMIQSKFKTGQDVVNYPNKLNSEFMILRNSLGGHDPRVTQGIRDRLTDIEGEWQKRKQEVNEIIQKDVANYNKTFKDKNVPALMTAPKEVEVNN